MIAELCVRNIDGLVLVEALTVWVDSATQMCYIGRKLESYWGRFRGQYVFMLRAHVCASYASAVSLGCLAKAVVRWRAQVFVCTRMCWPELTDEGSVSWK